MVYKYGMCVCASAPGRQPEEGLLGADYIDYKKILTDAVMESVKKAKEET